MIPGNGKRLFAVVLALVLQLGVAAGAVDLDASTQRDIRAATFEVVQLKPPDGEVTYERPLPLELIPYQQRIDLYRPVGTVFAIGPNRFVTAAHVLNVGAGSQFGPPALRDAAGHVYPIDQVLQYSQHEDFAVVSLRDPPPHVQVLKAGARPALNDVVFAVGNALGEGVVIRDGVFTSESPEEQEGKWNWLRFSAAASPGNSGGPLVNRRGQLLGVVLRKSPSENLNYALAIEQVLNAKQGQGRISGRIPVRLPIMDAAESAEYDEHFALPLGLPEFYKTWLGIIEKENEREYTQLFAHNEAHVFPRGAGSEKLLHFVEGALVPQRIHETQNHVWVVDAAKSQTVQLDHNGFVAYTADMVRLRAPDDMELSALYGDSKLQMDLFLKAYTLRRIVGTDSVRVTSLGKARTEETYADAYGRVWQIRAWAVPYEDMLLTVISLPTPEGYAGIYFKIPTGFWHVTMAQQKRLLDFIFLTMQGSLSRWQSYLAQKGIQPKCLGDIKIDVAGRQHVHYQSRRLDLDVASNLVKLSDSSILRLNFAFDHDADAVVWDVASVWVSEGPHSKNSILVWRKTEPPSDLPDGFQDDWHKMQSREFPYNAAVSSEEGETRIATTAIAPEDGKIRYVLRVAGEGTQPQEAMKRKSWICCNNRSSSSSIETASAGQRSSARSPIIASPYFRSGPSIPVMSALESFHPAVAAWFARTYEAPTPAQAEAWPAIQAGRDVLVAAPTGSGKTLAAFLAAIDQLVREGAAGALADETRVLYVSPLKALSNDIHRNLEAPLKGIRSELAALRSRRRADTHHRADRRHQRCRARAHAPRDAAHRRNHAGIAVRAAGLRIGSGHARHLPDASSSMKSTRWPPTSAARTWHCRSSACRRLRGGDWRASGCRRRRRPSRRSRDS